MKLNVWLGLAAVAGTALTAMAADITGKVTLKGTAPAEKDIPLDPNCGKMHAGGLKTRLYVVGGGGELADVFVYLKDGVTGDKFEVPTTPAVLDQKGCEYIPYVSGLQTGQKLAVKNSDPVLHNVHSTPAPDSGNKEKNLAQLPGSKDLEFAFENPELMMRFKCDVHPWMFSYVNVLKHPFYAVTGKDGSFTIKNVPKGNYTVEAYHRKAGKVEQKVTVADANASVNFAMDVK
jgi:hypothetical protein